MSAYFNNERRGEINEIRQEINNKSWEVRKGALKKIIAMMTIGRDVSGLFHDVVRCLESSELDIKKLVYLYVINTSRMTPADAMMVINNLRKDAAHKSNPIIRALAIRTMGYLRVESLNDYLVDPLLLGLKDSDPYVRKAAVLCVPKLIEVSKDGEYQGLIDCLVQLFPRESNSLVLANLLQALGEVSQARGRRFFRLCAEGLQKLLLVLGEAMEWGQVFILDTLAGYEPACQREAEQIVEGVLPRISHINPAVAFSTIKVILGCLPHLQSEELAKGLCRKMSQSIQSLAAVREPECRYVILANLHYIIEWQPHILENDIKKFFVKYDDPPYIKHEKLEILVRIVNEKKFEELISEFKEYLYETDPEYVTQVIRALAKVVVRFERAVEKGLAVLAKFMEEVAEHDEYGEETVNALIVAVQSILRKYPSKYNFNAMFGDVIKLMLRTTRPDAIQAAIWINGEYAEEIYPQSILFVQRMIQDFDQADPTMQLELITSAVKVFIKYPEDGQEFIIPLLSRATEHVSNADVRDRAFLYWRMLSVDPERTRQIVFGFRPHVRDEDALLEKEFVAMAIAHLGLFNTVFRKRPEDLFPQSLSSKLNIQVKQEVSEAHKP